MTFGRNHRRLRLGDKLIDLGHLNHQHLVLPQAGKNGADISIRVTFRSHVFSKSCVPPTGHDFLDENGQKRLFCNERYELSHLLPDFITQMVLENHNTWESRDRNRVNNLAIFHPNPETTQKYMLVYALIPSLAKNLDVELEVKSAYPCHNIPRIQRKFGVKQLIKTCYFQQKRVPK